MDHLDGCDRCRRLVAEVMRDSHAAGGASASSLQPGDRVFADGVLVAGRYEVLSLLGRGGMGEVYRAADRLLDQMVALKTVSGLVADDPQAIARLKKEVQLSRRVTHPNVCRVFDLGEHPGEAGPILFLTMEVVPGETLAARARRGPLAVRELAWIVRGVAAGMKAAHAAGVVHRDLKPQNVILRPARDGEEARAVVMDFGLARDVVGGELSNSISRRSLTGTPAYMAPEQLLAQATTPATDVYSFGVMFYELVAGRLPFRAASPLELATKRLVEPPAPLPDDAPLLRPGWRRVIEACLRRNPSDRPAGFDEVEAALEGGGPLLGEQTARAVRGARRRWPVFVAAAVAVATALLGLGLAWR
jgi:serine/threonine protein kinase